MPHFSIGEDSSTDLYADDHLRLDLYVGMPWRRAWELHLKCSNLTDENVTLYNIKGARRPRRGMSASVTLVVARDPLFHFELRIREFCLREPLGSRMLAVYRR